MFCMNPLYHKEYDDILPRALALARVERETLIEALQQSLIDDPNDELGTWEISDAWRAEIARRSAEFDRGDAKTVTYEEMRNRARLAANELGKPRSSDGAS
jgi:putative addiction module component (TIGR02574 family)